MILAWYGDVYIFELQCFLTCKLCHLCEIVEIALNYVKDVPIIFLFEFIKRDTVIMSLGLVGKLEAQLLT